MPTCSCREGGGAGPRAPRHGQQSSNRAACIFMVYTYRVEIGSPHWGCWSNGHDDAIDARLAGRMRERPVAQDASDLAQNLFARAVKLVAIELVLDAA